VLVGEQAIKVAESSFTLRSIASVETNHSR